MLSKRCRNPGCRAGSRSPPARLTRPHSSRRNSPGRLLHAPPGPGPGPALGTSPSRKPTAAGNSACVKLRSLGFSQPAVLRGKPFLVSSPTVTVTAVSSQRHRVSLRMYMAGVQPGLEQSHRWGRHSFSVSEPQHPHRKECVPNIPSKPPFFHGRAGAKRGALWPHNPKERNATEGVPKGDSAPHP